MIDTCHAHLQSHSVSEIIHHLPIRELIRVRCRYSTNVGWGLKCLTSDRPRQRAYEDEVGYRYYENACGQTVTIYVLGMWSSSLSFFRLFATQVLTTGPG
jgi:hypothetical protein